MKWWRKLPGWHKREIEFREWYVGLLSRVNLAADANYEQAVRVLSCAEEVSGYREVRYPKMNATRAAVEAELTPVVKSPVEQRQSIVDSLRSPTHV
jgi:indolepyruvate ferredoxin oxidoreductase